MASLPGPHRAYCKWREAGWGPVLQVMGSWVRACTARDGKLGDGLYCKQLEAGQWSGNETNWHVHACCEFRLVCPRQWTLFVWCIIAHSLCMYQTHIPLIFPARPTTTVWVFHLNTDSVVHIVHLNARSMLGLYKYTGKVTPDVASFPGSCAWGHKCSGPRPNSRI